MTSAIPARDLDDATLLTQLREVDGALRMVATLDGDFDVGALQERDELLAEADRRGLDPHAPAGPDPFGTMDDAEGEALAVSRPRGAPR